MLSTSYVWITAEKPVRFISPGRSNRGRGAFGFPKGIPTWLCRSIEIVRPSTWARWGLGWAASRERGQRSMEPAASAVRKPRRDGLTCKIAMAYCPSAECELARTREFEGNGAVAGKFVRHSDSGPVIQRCRRMPLMFHILLTGKASRLTNIVSFQ